MKTSSINFKNKLQNKGFLGKLVLIAIGFAALVWFLIRVIPKPSRAAYPCQQAAFPFASAFVIWLTGILTSSFAFVKARRKWQRSKYIIATVLFTIAMAIFIVTSTSIKYTPLMAKAYILSQGIMGNPLPEMNYFTAEDNNVVYPSAYVSIVKSVEEQAEDITFDEIELLVKDAIEKAGGLEDIISDGDTVVLKPNLVISEDGTASAQQLVPEVNGITTDYRVMQAIVNIVRLLNPSGQIYVLEGSAAGSTAENMDILEYDMITGIDSLVPLEDVCGLYQDTTSIHLQGVSLPPGKAKYVGANNRYWFHNLYYNADVVISVPVLKNHFYTGNTGSIKNVGIGSTPASIYGYTSTNILRYLIDHEGPQRTNLHYFIHDYFMGRPVDFVIVDGLQSIQHGPTSRPETQIIEDDQMNMRLILASNEPVAIDAIGSLLVSQDPAEIPHIFTLHNDTLGCCDARLLRVVGKKVGDEKKNFEITGTGALSLYDDFEPPVFSVDLCEVIGNQLHLSLTVDDQVNKVEVAIDGVYLGQIVIGGFDDIYLELDTLEVNDGSEIIVYAYDQYLNYSMQDIWLSVGQQIDRLGDISVYPNPCSNAARLRYLIHDIGYLISDLYSIDGRMIREIIRQEVMPGEHEVEIDVSDLPAGVYFVWVQAGSEVAVRKLIIR